MKMIKSAILIACMTSLANAAVVTVDTGFGVGVTDNGGTSIPNGSGTIRLGYFATLADGSLSGLTAATLLGDFQTYAGNVAAFGKSGLAGFFAISSDTGAKDFASSFIGENVYLLAFNADQTEGLIYKFGATFQADLADPNPPSSQSLTFTLNEANYLLGTTDSTLTGPVAVGAARMGVLIPEPSVALLGAFGVLGLLRRRR